MYLQFYKFIFLHPFLKLAPVRYNCMVVVMLLGFSARQIQAQTPFDGIMMPKNNACVFAGYSTGSFNQYWEGSKLRKNETIATVTRKSYAWMAAVGIWENLNVYAGFPWIQTSSSEPNGGKLAGAEGLQDLELAVKYQLLNANGKLGTTRAAATIDFTTPISNYLSDYQPYSLGLGAPQLTYQALASHQFSNLIYLRANAAYVWRGYTQAERIYYYANGSHYSDWMDVPSAWNFGAAIGGYLIGDDLRLEASYSNFVSQDGDDIRPYNASQPTNKVEATQVGFLLQYIPDFAKGFGFIATHHRTLEGRNTGKVNATSFGLTYQFSYRKNGTNHEN